MEHKPYKPEKMSKNKKRLTRAQYGQDDEDILRDPTDHYSRNSKHKKVQYRDWWNDDMDVD